MFKLLGFLSGLLVSATPLRLQEATILKHARTHFSTVGRLEKLPKRFIYVKSSDEYIEKTIELLEERITPPSPYFGVRKVGAHIVVITEAETKNRTLFLPQLGQPVLFWIKDFSSEEVENARHYYYTVEIPQVELLRLANGLPAKIPGKPFRLLVGTQTRE